MPPTRKKRRLRAIASWLPAALLVPAGLAAVVEVSEPSDTAEEEMSSQVLPLEPGTTWVYAVYDHGSPSGTRVRQVLGPTGLVSDGALRSGVRISSVYDDYPGSGRQSVDAYVGVEGRDLMQYGLIARGEEIQLDPHVPAYRLPATIGTSWDYDGRVGTTPLTASAEVTSVGDVEVGGRTFDDCTEWTTEQVVGEPVEGDAPEVVTEWTCPGIGVVRSSYVHERDDLEVTEELVEFHGVGEDWVDDDWVAESRTDEPSPVVEGTTFAAVDQARSNAVASGSLDGVLAWSDARDGSSVFSPVSDGTVEVLGQDDGTVTAREVESGELRWQLALTPPIVVSPAIGGDLVYLADGAKNLWALSLADGRARWVHRFDDVASATPVVGDSAVAVAVEDGTVVGLAADDGTVLWSAGLSDVARNPPALADDQLVVGDGSGLLQAIDPDSGEVSWSASLDTTLEQGPAVADGQVLAADADGVITSLDLGDGHVRWQARGHDIPNEPLAVGSDRVVTVGGDGWVECFSLHDGDSLWRRKVQGVDVAPVLAGDHVVMVTGDGRMAVLDLADGSRTASWSLPRPSAEAELRVSQALGVVGGNLVVTASVEDPNFRSISYAYRLDGRRDPGIAFTSTAGGAYPLSSILATEPVLDGEDVYVLDTDGILFRDGGAGPAPILDGIRPAVGLAAGDGVVVVPRGEEVVAVRGRDGKQLWTIPTPEAYISSLPAIAGDTVFVPMHGAGLIAADLRSGTPRWVVPTLGAMGSSTPLPLPGGDVAYAADGLARYEGRTGDEVWRLGGPLDGAAAYTPIATDDGVIVATLVVPDPTSPIGERNVLAAVDAADGRVLWTHDLVGTPVAIPPAAGDGVAVVVDSDNLASAFDLTTGEVRWTARLGTAPAGPPSVHDGVVTLVERGRSKDLLQRDSRITFRDAVTGAYLGSYEPPSSNDSTLPSTGVGPDGERLVPAIGKRGYFVVVLEAVRG